MTKDFTLTMVSLVSFPEKAILKVILSQTQMFNLFPVHVDLSSIMNILLVSVPGQLFVTYQAVLLGLISFS